VELEPLPAERFAHRSNLSGVCGVLRGMRTTGLTACLLALAACGHASAHTAVAEPAALSAAPLAASPTSDAPTAAGPATAPASSAAPISAAPTSAAHSSATARTPGLDVDGDGVADSVTTRLLPKHRAVLDVQLGSGKSLTSKAFTLYASERAGIVSGYDLDGDHRDEVFVEAPGGDGIGYDLFQWVGSRLVAVPAPKGQESSYLYIGGGRYYESSFGCAHHALVQAKEAPAVASTASLPPDPAYRVTTTTYRLAGGTLTATSSHTVRAHNHGAAQALLDAVPAGCGTSP
jgi:hypothetical protein